jgi:hypothetical protein
MELLEIGFIDVHKKYFFRSYAGDKSPQTQNLEGKPMKQAMKCIGHILSQNKPK